jgi:RHS repeat-associated protein
LRITGRSFRFVSAMNRVQSSNDSAAHLRQAIFVTLVALSLLLISATQAFATVLPSKITADTTLTAAGSPYTGGTTINSGVTVKVEPGAKFMGSPILVKGTLKVEGSAKEPVVFTGLKDEAPNEWCSITFEPGSDVSVIDHAELRYGGGCGVGMVKVEGSSPTIINSTFRKSGNNAIGITSGAPEIAHNEFLANTAGIYYPAGSSTSGQVNIHDNFFEGGSYGINVVIPSTATVAGKSLGANTITKTTSFPLLYKGPDIPGNITGNTVVENSLNLITVGSGSKVATSSTWSYAGSTLKLEGAISVASGAIVRITKGVRLIGNPGMNVKGTLKVEGTAEEPVVFTGLKDEAPNEWCSITFEPGSGASVIDHAELKNGGACGGGMIKVEGSSPTITNSTLRRSGNNAMAIYSGAPEIAHNDFLANVAGIYYPAGSSTSGQVNIHDNFFEGGSYGINVVIPSTATVAGKSLGANTITKTTSFPLLYKGPDVPGNVTGNTLIENSLNMIRIGEGSKVTTPATWNYAGSPVKLEGALTVASGAVLTITKGVRLTGNPGMNVKGTLKVEGTDDDPVVFTGAKDLAPNEWCSITFEPGSGASVIDRAELKYGGACGIGMIRVEGSSPTITNSTFRKSSNNAIGVVSGTPKLEWNRFRGNAGGVSYSGAGKLSAPRNDWGCGSGPKPAGCGDSVTSNVEWKPAVQLPELAGHCRGGESQCGEGADPVSLATGELSYFHRDLLLTNKGAVPLEFARAYSSDSAADTGLGPGWSQTALASATELSSGAVLILRQDGRQDLFYPTESGYKVPSGVTGSLSKVEGTFQLTTLEQTTYRFDTSGRIASIIDDHGLKTAYGYDANGRLATITDPSSQTLTFSYNASNHITLVKDSTGREVKYGYSVAGDLATVTDALGGVTEYTYDSAHRLKTIKDPRGNVILKNTYDGQGRVVEQRDGLENLWTLEYKEGETIVTEPEGGEIAYGFDSQDRVVSEEDQLGHTTTTGYDAAGNIDEIVKPGGAKWTFGHDVAGNLTSVVDPEEGERSYEYNGLNRLTSFTDERGETWSYEWDEGNDLLEVTDPAEGETTFTHDASGLPLTVTDPNEHTTTFTYDARGNRLTAKDPLEDTTAYAYNSRNQLTSKTEPGLKAETYGRNALGDLLSTTTPEGNKTEYIYDANGMPTQVKDPAANIWKIERNAMERPTAYIDPFEQKTEISYDGNLNRVAVTDRRGKETTYAYDLANQPTEIVKPEGGDWEFGYDARGNRTDVVEPRENATAYEFDLLGRMTQAAEPLGATTSYDYDPAGNLTSFTDPRENTTELARDELGRVTEISQPLGKTTTFTYDGVGNRLTRATAAGTLEFGYDAANRRKDVSAAESVLRAFDYDSAGRLIGATDAQADEIEVGYDNDGRVVSIDDGRGQTVSRKYDSRGNVVEQTDGRGTLKYEFDKLSRMTGLTDPQGKALDFGYDAEGNPTKVELPNGVVTTNEYDDAGRLAGTTSAKGESNLESLDYEYDPSGNRIAQVDRLSQETSYGYDALNRLTGFDPPGEGSTAYDYDPAGNRTKAGATTYSFNDLNQLTSASDGTTYDYDSAGRLIEVNDGETSTTYAWNPRDELIRADTGAQEVAYAYDALGRQILRDDGSAIRLTHYGDLSDLPILDSDAEGIPTMSYVQGPAGLIEQRSSEATSFPLRDAHGDITTVADGEGEVASRQSYGPWGEHLSGPSLEMGWLGAQQRRSDPAAELVQMGQRPYMTGTGAFLTEDPVLGRIGTGMTVDRYLYALNNPLNRYDLNGRDVCLFGGCIDPDDVVSIAEDLEGGVATTEEGGSAVGSATGDAADDGWDWTAPGRNWTAERARDFWKAHGNTLTGIYNFAGGNWRTCLEGGSAGAAVGFYGGTAVFPVVGSGAGAAGGGVLGCTGLVGASLGIEALAE